MAELSPGSVFAGHEILSVAGRGGMGIVYRALDLRLKREVALKVIAPEQSSEPEFRVRFRRECEVAASIHHANLIPVYTAGEEQGHLYVTMRFVDGIDLAHLIDRTRGVEPAHAAQIIAQVAHALDAAHAFGVVHRDVKPANVLLDGEHALLTDFGLQRDLNATTRVTEPGTLIGSFDYTAPEQLEDGDVDARTDVYALGCVLYEAVTGEVPYPRDSPAAKMYAHLGAPVPTAPGPFEQIILRALAKDPAERFPTAGALGRAALEAVGTQVTSSPVAPKPAPLPPALLTETGSQPFIGRAHFRERIAEHLEQATEGKRRFILIEGEPGIGKTRLATEAARDAHDAGVTVLYGRSDPDSLLPYQPFAMALPGIEPRPADRFSFFDAVSRRLAFRPTVLILDDLHWADSATTQLLDHVLSDPEPMRLLVLATTREAGDRLPPATERLTLTGLERHELSALVTALGEPAPSNESIRSLHERTAGNPFFVAETLRAPGLPDSIKDVVQRRLAELAEPTRAALTTAAVMGRDFRLDVLETLADDALDAVEEACARGLIREAEELDQFRFAHALVHETLYESMSNARRTRVHNRIGEALEQHGASPGELARHFYAARHLDGGERAHAYAVQAAAIADFAEAVTQYRHALEIKPSLDLHLALGAAELRAGDPAARATFQQAAALASDDPVKLAHAALGFNARMAASSVLDPEGIALLEEADAALQDSPLRARVKARLADALHFAAQTERTLRLSEDALALAGDDPAAKAEALVARHTALLHPDHLEERLRLAREIIAIGSPELTALGRWWCIYDLLEAGEQDAARAQHAALAELADGLRQPLFRHFAAVWDVVWAQIADRPADIERLSEDAYELGARAAGPDAAMIRTAQVLAIRLQQGRLREYLATVEPLVEAFPASTGWRAALALGLLVAGEEERGRAVYDALPYEAIPRDMLWIGSITLLSWCCTLLGDAQRAPELYALLLPYRDHTVQDVLAANWGSVERFLGSLAAVAGDYERAATHFERALERNAAHPQALRLTRTEYAQLLLAHGEEERGAALLHAALEDAEAAGLTAVADSLQATWPRSPAGRPPRPAPR